MTAPNFAHVASRLFNTPLMLRPEKAEMLVAALADRLGIAKLERMGAEAMTAVELNSRAQVGREEERRPRRYYDLVDGIACIPVDGTLVHKLGTVDAYSGMVGYDGIIAKVRQARADARDGNVRGILINYHSPGGEVFGCFDCAEEIAAGNEKNGGGVPVWSIVNDEACSAGYALACAGDKVFGTQTSASGSIGAYILFVDWTKALADEGIAVRFFREYDLKARGSGLEELDEETANKLQASVAQTVDMFARLVAANRRTVSMKAIAEMRSEWFDPPDALRLGLIDGIMSEVETFAKFQRSLARKG
jgi:ClpP class serine protease